MPFRFKSWDELTPFQQGFALGCMKCYGLVGGVYLGAWIFDIPVLETMRGWFSL